MPTISAASGSTILISQGTTVNTIKYSINGGTTVDDVAGDWTLVNTTPTAYLYVIFATNLSISSIEPIKHFIIGSAYIKIDGNFYTVTISENVNNYPGLIQNGTNAAETAFSNIWITQLGIICNDGSHLSNRAGWLCQEHFCLRGGTSAALNTIEKCWSNATTASGPNHAGGLIGGHSGYCTVTNCYNSNTGVAGDDSGGIVGADATSVNVTNCYSWSTAATRTGAIFGSGATTCTSTNCYGLQAGTNGTNTNFYNGLTWSNSTASSTLTNGPNYTGGVTVVGTVWTDISASGISVTNSTYWRLSTFNRNAYTVNYSNPYNKYSATFEYIVDKVDTNNRLTATPYYIIGVNNAYSNEDISLNGSNGVVFGSGLVSGTYSTYVLYNDAATSNYTIMDVNVTTEHACYHESTQILCHTGYVPINKLTIGTLVKTSTGEYKRVKVIGSTPIVNTTLYRLPKEKNKDLIDDLIITGNHCILVDRLTETQMERSKKYWKTFHTIDEKQLLLACIGEDFIQYKENKTIVYQIVLEDSNPKRRHGIWANGILSETMSMFTYLSKNKNRFRNIEI